MENRGSTRKLAEAYYKKGMCLQKIEQCRDLREPDKAKQNEIKALIEKALELSPDMPEALMQMGKIYKTLGGSDSGGGNLEKAIGMYSKVILLKKNYMAAYNNRGLCYLELEEHEKAIDDFSETLRIRPDDSNYYNNRGNCYAKLGEHKKAKADFSKARRIQPDDTNF